MAGDAPAEHLTGDVIRGYDLAVRRGIRAEGRAAGLTQPDAKATWVPRRMPLRSALWS